MQSNTAQAFTIKASLLEAGDVFTYGIHTYTVAKVEREGKNIVNVFCEGLAFPMGFYTSSKIDRHARPAELLLLEKLESYERLAVADVETEISCSVRRRTSTGHVWALCTKKYSSAAKAREAVMNGKLRNAGSMLSVRMPQVGPFNKRGHFYGSR